VTLDRLQSQELDRMSEAMSVALREKSNEGRRIMFRRVIAVMAMVVASVLIAAPSASGDNLGPCNNSGGPGHSDYAAHHIVPADLGNGAHKPGSHGGYSVCLGTGRNANKP
jgi:hypothetical protein